MNPEPAPQGTVNLPLPEAMKRAVAFHRAGKFGEAEGIYRAVLAVAPNDADALHLLGVIEGQRDHIDEACRLFRRAVEFRPDFADAHSNLGNVLNRLQRHEEALVECDRALAIQPDVAETRHNRGIALRGLGRNEEAIAAFDHTLAIDPRHRGAWCNRGLALQRLERNEEALASYDHALEVDPDFVEAWHNRGTVLRELKRPEEALASWDRALAIKPAFPESLNNRSGVLRSLKRYAEALASLDRAVALRPAFTEAWQNRGDVLRGLGRNEDALASYTRAVAIDPRNAAAYELRAYALYCMGRHAEAADDYARALAVDADRPYAQGMLVHLKMYVCDWQGQDDSMARVTALVRAGTRPPEPFPFLVSSDSAADVLLCARSAIGKNHPPSPSPLWNGERYAHDRIRVAYLSSDFFEHATAMLIAEMFERHDRSRFEVTAVSWGPAAPSALRSRIAAACEHFVDVRERSDADVARWLRKQEIDIAVDLKGFTFDSRPSIFAQRPAPIQVSYLGHPGTMGAPYLDYIVADEVVIPPAQREFYAEQVVYLPDSYQVNDSARRIAERTPSRTEAGLPEQGFVYCSFNSTYKITPAMFDVWMRLLRQVEGSVLWLLEGNAAAVVNLRREAAARGVAPERLVFAPRTTVEQHLARHRLADLFLDTLPCNAHTTASDALWAGLPVVTCLGGTFAGRVAGSLLRAVGLQELVTQSLPEYESLALRLAADAGELALVKAKLARNRATYPLFDSDRFRRHLEAAYATMWERYQQGLPPAGFTVAAQAATN